MKKTFDIKINRKKLNIARTCVLNSQFLWFFLGLLYLAKKKLILTLEYSKTRHTFFISFCTAAAVKSSSIFPPIKIYIFSLNDQLSHWAELTVVPKYISKWSKQTKSKGVGTPIKEVEFFSIFFLSLFQGEKEAFLKLKKIRTPMTLLYRKLRHWSKLSF